MDDDQKTLMTLRASTDVLLSEALQAMTRQGPMTLHNIPVRLNGVALESVQLVRDNATGDHFINLTTGE